MPVEKSWNKHGGERAPDPQRSDVVFVLLCDF